MSWLRLSFVSNAQHARQIGELLEQFDAIAVSYAPLSNEPVFDEAEKANTLWEQTCVSALFNLDIDLDILLACVRNRVGTDNIIDQKTEFVEDKEWSDVHKQQHGAMLFGHQLCIYPSWSNPPATSMASVMLDPGLAFGTGAHTTTSLCLTWLAQQDLSYKSVIDYGCGSGVLGLAAARLGARKVYSIDIDPQAILATRTNADKNNLRDKLEILYPDETIIPAADILIANILLNPLLELTHVFADLVKPGGKLVLSGILSVQAEDCLAAYSPWFKMMQPVYLEEWALIEGVRTETGSADQT